MFVSSHILLRGHGVWHGVRYVVPEFTPGFQDSRNLCIYPLTTAVPRHPAGNGPFGSGPADPIEAPDIKEKENKDIA